MHRILRAALGHVTVQAGGGRARAFDAGRSLRMNGLVTTLADRHIVADSRFSARNVVRVVTRRARHLASEETGGLAQAVWRTGNLELVFLHATRMVEVDEG